MKQKGICPKCSSSDILTNAQRTKQGHRAFLGISMFSTIRVATYVCMQCGFVEEYLDEDRRTTPSKIDKLRTHWKKP